MSTWDGYNQTIEANRFGNVYIVDYLDLSGRFIVQNSGDISLNRLFVMNDASFSSNISINDNITTNLKYTANHDVSLNNRLFVMNDASFTSNVYVNGNVIHNLKMIANHDVSFNNRLFVQNDASFNSNIYVKGNLITNVRMVIVNDNVNVGTDISCNGNITIGKDLIVGGNLAVKNYTAQNIINTTTTNYQLVVSEDLSLNGRLSVLSDASFNGKLQINRNVGIGTANPVGILDICGSMIRTTFAATGNIGIGTTAPKCPLHVISRGNTDPIYNGVVIECTNNDSSTADAIMSLRTSQSGGNPYISYNVQNRAGWSMGMDSTDNNFKLAQSYNSITTNTRMTQQHSTGFIGIGTSWSYAPRSYFQVYGNTLASASSNADTGSNHHLVLTSTPSGAQPSTPYSMAFGYHVANNIGYINARGNSTSMPICFQTRGGNLGIGMTNPTAELHVNDTIKIGSTKPMKQILLAGSVAGGAGAPDTGTVAFSTAFAAAPAVIASINVNHTTRVYKINIDLVTTTGFAWRKTFNNGNTVFDVQPASSESFNWIAIGI